MWRNRKRIKTAAFSIVAVYFAIWACPVWTVWDRRGIVLWIVAVASPLILLWITNLSAWLQSKGRKLDSWLMIVLVLPLFLYAAAYIYEHLFDRSGWYPGKTLIDLYAAHWELIVVAFALAILIGFLGRIARRRRWSRSG